MMHRHLVLSHVLKENGHGFGQIIIVCSALVTHFYNDHQTLSVSPRVIEL